EHVYGCAFAGQPLGDRTRNRAPDLLLAVEQEDDLAVELAGFSEHLESCQGHRDTGFHIERARTPEPAFADATRHAPKSADRPDRVDVPEEEDASTGRVWSMRPEPDFKHIAKPALTVDPDPAAEPPSVRRNCRSAGVHGCLAVGGRFAADQR